MLFIHVAPNCLRNKLNLCHANPAIIYWIQRCTLDDELCGLAAFKAYNVLKKMSMMGAGNVGELERSIEESVKVSVCSCRVATNTYPSAVSQNCDRSSKGEYESSYIFILLSPSKLVYIALQVSSVEIVWNGSLEKLYFPRYEYIRFCCSVRPNRIELHQNSRIIGLVIFDRHITS